MTERKKPPPGWKKGQSGNPAGRPPGIGSFWTTSGRGQFEPRDYISGRLYI